MRFKAMLCINKGAISAVIIFIIIGMQSNSKNNLEQATLGKWRAVRFVLSVNRIRTPAILLVTIISALLSCVSAMPPKITYLETSSFFQKEMN